MAPRGPCFYRGCKAADSIFFDRARFNEPGGKTLAFTLDSNLLPAEDQTESILSRTENVVILRNRVAFPLAEAPVRLQKGRKHRLLCLTSATTSLFSDYLLFNPPRLLSAS